MFYSLRNRGEDGSKRQVVDKPEGNELTYIAQSSGNVGSTRITNEAALDKVPTTQEIRNTWIRNINRRLQLERLMTDTTKYGKKALKATLVEKTWWEFSETRNSYKKIG